MKTQIAGTTLMAVGVVHRAQQQNMRRPEQGSWCVAFAVEDEATGETGHVSIYQEYDKRDMEEEEYRTDNPALFANNLPTDDWYWLPESQGDPIGGNEMPYYEHELQYDKDEAGVWGYRV